jgi:hypothetical protein
MSKIIAAVGGAGQEVALASLRIAYMAGLQLPRVFVFDSDQFDRAQEVAGEPTRSQILRSLGEFVRYVDDGNPVEFVQPVDRSRMIENVSNLFGEANLTPKPVADILSVLLTERQRNTRIIDGFHGEPTVGAMTFADCVCSDRLDAFVDGVRQNDRVVKPGLAQLTERADVPHSLVIAGGTAGGTGPGVVPVLSRRVDEWRREQAARRRAPDHLALDLSIFVQLPWFQITNGNPEEDIAVARMQRNSACLVRHYATDLERMADRVVLCGLPKMVTRPSAGPHHQPETLHYLNVLSGCTTCELLNPQSTLRASMADRAIYGLAMDDGKSALDVVQVTLDSPLNNIKEVPLRRVIDASRVWLAFVIGLDHQLSQPKELALPRPIWQLARKLGGTRTTDLRAELQRIAAREQEMLTWFVTACRAATIIGGTRDREDQQVLWRIPDETIKHDLATVRGLLPWCGGAEDNLVSGLFERCDLGRHVDGQPTATGLAKRMCLAVRMNVMTDQLVAR